MKKTKKAWVFFILHLFFLLAVPCFLVWQQYGDLTTKYKISVTAIMLTILIFCIFKKIVLNKWIKTLDIKLANIETNALSITDKTAIESNKKAWRSMSLLSLIISLIVPILVFVLAITTIKVVEQGLIKLYGCLMFILISMAIGILFKVLEIYAVKLPHEE